MISFLKCDVIKHFLTCRFDWKVTNPNPPLLSCFFRFSFLIFNYRFITFSLKYSSASYLIVPPKQHPRRFFMNALSIGD